MNVLSDSARVTTIGHDHNAHMIGLAGSIAAHVARAMTKTCHAEFCQVLGKYGEIVETITHVARGVAPRDSGRKPACQTGGAMVVDRGRRGEGASVTPRRRRRDERLPFAQVGREFALTGQEYSTTSLHVYYTCRLTLNRSRCPSLLAHALDVCKTENPTRDTTRCGARLTAPSPVRRKRPFATHTDRLDEVQRRIRRQRLAAAILTAPRTAQPLSRIFCIERGKPRARWRSRGRAGGSEHSLALMIHRQPWRGAQNLRWHRFATQSRSSPTSSWTGAHNEGDSS